MKGVNLKEQVKDCESKETEVSEIVYMTHLIGSPLLGNSMLGSPQTEEPIEEIEEPVEELIEELVGSEEESVEETEPETETE